ncbi:hypothetical protein AKJ16_DCAP08363 [Drosera capensis]
MVLFSLHRHVLGSRLYQHKKASNKLSGKVEAEASILIRNVVDGYRHNVAEWEGSVTNGKFLLVNIKAQKLFMANEGQVWS